MTPTEQDKPINASDELRVEIVTTPEEMCEHGVDLRLCNCHRCDGTAIYTEADRKRVELAARIDEFHRRYVDEDGECAYCEGTAYSAEHDTRLAELKAQQGEV